MEQQHQATDGLDAGTAKVSTKPRGMGRRALLRGGAAAAPVLLTLHSGPVAASGAMSCTVASSFVSVATFASRNAGATTLQCSTMNAGHWHAQAQACGKLHPTQRPRWATISLKQYLGQSSGVLNGLGSRPDEYQVWEVMGLGSAPATAGELGVLHHVLGLALSIDHGGMAVNTGGRMNTAYLAGIWQNYKLNGRYLVPVGGVNWSDAELISWLKMLQYPIPVPNV
jgi:hypothetical protein